MTHQFDDSLAHFGIKGMRWGVRKKPDPGFPKVQGSQRSRKEEARYLSSQELQNRINRANLERQYAQLAPQSAGRRIASKFKTSMEDQLVKKGAALATNSLFFGADIAISQMKNPQSKIYIQQGEAIYNVWSKVRPK